MSEGTQVQVFALRANGPASVISESENGEQVEMQIPPLRYGMTT